jgi:hypothetical protein
VCVISGSATVCYGNGATERVAVFGVLCGATVCVVWCTCVLMVRTVCCVVLQLMCY